MTLSRADQGNLGCRVYLSVSGSSVSALEVALSFPRAALELTPDFLPDGDMHDGSQELDSKWTYRISAQRLAGAFGQTSTNDQTVRWDIPSFSAGTSVSADVTFSTLSNLPPGDYTLDLDVGWDGGELPTQRVNLTIEAPQPISTQLLAPNRLSNNGPFFARLRTWSHHGTARKDGGFLIHMPYYDSELDTYLSDGAFDPVNPAHTLLLDPEETEVIVNGGGFATTKTPGELTAVSGENTVVEWRADGGAWFVRQGFVGRRGPSTNQEVQITVKGPFALTPELGTISVSSCVSPTLIPTHECKSRNVTVAEGAPIRLQHDIVGQRNSAHSGWEANAVEQGDRVSQRWTFQNWSVELTDVDIFSQAPNHSGDSGAALEEACWSNTAVHEGREEPLGFTLSAQGDNPWAIYVSTVPSDRGGALNDRAVPAADAVWTRCSTGQCCGIDELASAGVDPSDVQEVRFYAAGSGPDTLWFNGSSMGGALRWRLPLDAPPSADGTESTNPPTLTNASMGSVIAVEHGGDTIEGFDGHIGQVVEVKPEQSCSIKATGFAPDAQTQASYPLQNPYHINLHRPYCHPIHGRTTGSTVQIYAEISNNGLTGVVDGAIEACTTTPDGWRFTSGVTVQGFNHQGSSPLWPAELVTERFDPETRELCVEVAFSEDPDSPHHQLIAGAAHPAPEEGFYKIRIRANGQLLPGPERIVFEQNSLRVGSSTCGEQTFEPSCGGFQRSDASNSKPSLRVGMNTPYTVIGPRTPVTFGLEVHNPYYGENGSSGQEATGPASDVVSYHKIPKIGDFEACSGGDAQADFVSATSADALDIWVSTNPDPERPRGDLIAPGGDWVRCGDSHCGSAELLQAGVDAADIQWIALAYGEVEITDLEPRGRAPFEDQPKVDAPYTVDLRIIESGLSEDRTRLCTGTELVGSNFLPLTVNSDIISIPIDYRCGENHFGVDETCNGLDEDCDGDIDEGLDVCFFPDVALTGAAAPTETHRGGRSVLAWTATSTAIELLEGIDLRFELPSGTAIDPLSLSAPCDGIEEDGGSVIMRDCALPPGATVLSVALNVADDAPLGRKTAQTFLDNLPFGDPVAATTHPSFGVIGVIHPDDDNLGEVTEGGSMGVTLSELLDGDGDASTLSVGACDGPTGTQSLPSVPDFFYGLDIELPDDPRGFVSRSDFGSGRWSDAGNDAFDGYGRLTITIGETEERFNENRHGQWLMDVDGTELGLTHEKPHDNVWRRRIFPVDPNAEIAVDLEVDGNLGSDSRTDGYMATAEFEGVLYPYMVTYDDAEDPSDPPVVHMIVPADPTQVDRVSYFFEEDDDDVEMHAEGLALPATVYIVPSYGDPAVTAAALAQDGAAFGGELGAEMGPITIEPGRQFELPADPMGLELNAELNGCGLTPDGLPIHCSEAAVFTEGPDYLDVDGGYDEIGYSFDGEALYLSDMPHPHVWRQRVFITEPFEHTLGFYQAMYSGLDPSNAEVGTLQTPRGLATTWVSEDPEEPGPRVIMLFLREGDNGDSMTWERFIEGNGSISITEMTGNIYVYQVITNHAPETVWPALLQDIQAQGLSTSAITTEQGGRAWIEGSPPEVFYEAPDPYVGEDSFTYSVRADDDPNNCQEATITVEVTMADEDEDTVRDREDNCPLTPNTAQGNIDGDDTGDACDPDIDGDELPNDSDNCPSVDNAEQDDLDDDSIGDACDPDVDGDEVPNEDDNCPAVANGVQDDSDDDGLGDGCDPRHRRR